MFFNKLSFFNWCKLTKPWLNEQSKCETRRQFVNVSGDDPMFFPFSIKTSKCSGSCNNFNNPLTKLCVPDAVRNLNVKVFNLVSGTNETRRIEWHATFTCKCRFNSSVCNNKQRWNDDKCRCERKELIDKDVCNEVFIWNPSNCECECYKSCDFSEYLDFKNCKCKKRLVNKLVERSSAEECTENIEETKLVEITSSKNENKYKRSSCTLYIVLFSIFFTINVGNGSYIFVFIGTWKKMLVVLSLVPALKPI